MVQPVKAVRLLKRSTYAACPGWVRKETTKPWAELSIGGWGSRGDELSPVRETEAGLAPGLSE